MRFQRIVVAALAALAVGCGQTETTSSSASGDGAAGEKVTLAFNTGGAPTVEFDVPAMHCEFACAPKVRATLESQPGVVDVKVDVDAKVATVAVDEAEFDADAAIEALVAANFPETALHQDGPALIAPAAQPAGDSAIQEAEPVDSAG